MWASSVAAVPEQALLVFAAVADGGLTRNDLFELTSYTPEDLDTALAAASRAGLGKAASRWTGKPVHVIADAGQRLRVTDAAGERAAADCTAALHTWAESYRADGWPDNTPEYLLDDYFRLLKSTGDVLRMTACAIDRARHAQLRDLTGGDVAAVHEVAACQVALADQEAPDLAAAAVLAVLRDELTGLSDHLPTSLPATLATAGDSIRADQLARSFTTPARRTAALTGLTVALIEEGRLAQARHTISELTVAVSELSATDENAAPDAVARLAAAGQWISAERIARATPSREARLAALRTLVDAQISAGHLDQAEHLALTLTADDGGTDGYSGDDTGGADRQALTSVIAALAADGQGDRAEQLARAFPTPDAVRDYGGVLVLPTLAKALAVSGQVELFHRLVRAMPHGQIRNQLLATATAAVAATGDIRRADELARSITDNEQQRDALHRIEAQLLAAGDTRLVQSLAHAIEPPLTEDSSQTMYKPERSETPVPLAILGSTPGVIRALVEQRLPDLAETVAGRLPGVVLRAKGFCELAVALAESGDTIQAERLHEEHHNTRRNHQQPFDGRAVLRSVTQSHLAAGDHNEALRTAQAARRLHSDGQPLEDVTVWLIGNGMTADAERLIVDPSSGLGSAVAAAAYAAAGDAGSARRHARNAAKLPQRQKTQPLQPLPLLLFAEALVEAEECDFARHLTERAIALMGSNDVLLSRATIVLARTGAIFRAETLARRFSFWSHREPALEAITLAYVAAGEVDRAQSVADVMDSQYSHKVQAMVAVATALTRDGDHDLARQIVAQAAEIGRDLSYSKDSALLLVIRAQIELGDIANAEQTASAIGDFVEQQAARNLVNAARTKTVARTAPLRVWQSAGPGEVPTVVAEAAKWLKEAGDESGATQLLAKAAECARAAEGLRASGAARAAGNEPSAWVCQLLARALCGIGRHWHFVLPSLAAIDRTVPLAVIATLGLDRPDEPGAAGVFQT